MPSSRSHLCKLDINLTYPQTGGHFPSVTLVSGAKPGLMASNMDANMVPYVVGQSIQSAIFSDSDGFLSAVRKRHVERSVSAVVLRPEERRRKREIWKRDMVARPNGTIDPWYGCYVWNEMVDYALNYTYPWSTSHHCDLWHIRSADRVLHRHV